MANASFWSINKLVVALLYCILLTLVGGTFRQREDEFSKFRSRMHAKQLEDLHMKSQVQQKPKVKNAAPSIQPVKIPTIRDGTPTVLQQGMPANTSHIERTYAAQFYNLSLALVPPGTQFSNLAKIHIIRVPKASSSSLSAIARRAVGCNPPGPCCHFPGEPKGSCASKEMIRCQDAKKVIGCTDHFPLIWYLHEARVPTISMMRNPFSRSLSGFFYPGIHHNSDCTADIDTCFLEYTRNVRWQNVVVKMLSGNHAYSPTTTCEHNTTCHHSLQLAADNLRFFAFMGVAEMWELSLLVLHQKLPILAPNLQEFLMGTFDNINTKGSRVNMKEGYAEFRLSALSKYAKELHEQNALDAALYRQVVHNMCNDLHIMKLWDYELVRTYWKERSPYMTDICS